MTSVRRKAKKINRCSADFLKLRQADTKLPAIKSYNRKNVWKQNRNIDLDLKKNLKKKLKKDLKTDKNCFKLIGAKQFIKGVIMKI